jgi:hypothetical protein
MSERRRIIKQLQEQINQIDEEIEKLNLDRDLHYQQYESYTKNIPKEAATQKKNYPNYQ